MLWQFDEGNRQGDRSLIPGVDPRTQLVGMDGTWPTADNTGKLGWNFVALENWSGQIHVRVRRLGNAGYWGQPSGPIMGQPIGIAMKETGG